jgi:hypothetical protein
MLKPMKMKMQMNSYWPQQKVFLYGMLALFPEMLKGEAMYDAEQFLQLNLTKVNRQKILLELIDYLTEYEHDKLTTGRKLKPEQFVNQQERLLLAIRKKYPDHGYHPTIDLMDIWQDSKDHDPLLAPFWELIFAEHFRTGFIAIKNIGYEGTYAAPGRAGELPMPFVELTVVPGTLFQRAIEPPKLQKVPPAATPLPMAAPPIATVNMDKKGLVYASLAGGEKRLIKKLRVESAPYNFMNHVLGHQNKDIARSDIQTKVEGCETKLDMTELVRRCGFTGELVPLKSVFFGGTTKKNVCFKAAGNLTQSQLELLLMRQEVTA